MNQPPHGDGPSTEPSSAADDFHRQTKNNSTVDSVVEAALRYLDEPSTALEIGPDTAPQARALVEMIAVVREDHVALEHIRSGEPPIVAPPLADDPLAVALGLVPPEHAVLSGPALKSARQRAGVKPSELARRLSERGHMVRPGDLQGWENADSLPVSPGLLAAIASSLGIDEPRLTDVFEGPLSLVTSRGFRSLVKRFAAVARLSLAEAQTSLLAAVAAPARRGTSFDDQQMLSALEAFVEEHERRIGDQS